MAPLIVQMTMGVATAILGASQLSFIGLGVQPPNPEWGAMLSAGRNYIRNYPHMVIFPGVIRPRSRLQVRFSTSSSSWP